MHKHPENCQHVVKALRDLRFELTKTDAAEILRGKDFVQLKNGPFDLDLVFAPDGIERFEDAWLRRVEVDGFYVCSIDDIIPANRQRIESKIRNPCRDFSLFSST